MSQKSRYSDAWKCENVKSQSEVSEKCIFFEKSCEKICKIQFVHRIFAVSFG